RATLAQARDREPTAARGPRCEVHEVIGKNQEHLSSLHPRCTTRMSHSLASAARHSKAGEREFLAQCQDVHLHAAIDAASRTACKSPIAKTASCGLTPELSRAAKRRRLE